MDTKAVIEHHLDAMGTGDLDRILSDYTESSKIIAMGGVHSGLETLRALFGQFVDGPFKPGAHTFTLNHLVVDGEFGMIEWSLAFEGGNISFGTDTFHVVDGKIALQTGAAVFG
jgi:ketosteroid isomerase-like protein